MVDENAVWPAEKHTRAKHAILARYLHAWAPILSRQLAKEGSADQPLYVDAFAGPGIYAGGDPGSPIIALEAALAQPELPTPIQFMFVEKDEARHKSLNDEIGRLRPRLNECRHIYLHPVVHGGAVQALTRFMTDRQASNMALGPALFFLDQFG